MLTLLAFSLHDRFLLKHFIILVVLLNFRRGVNNYEDLLSNSSPLNHWFVDKINVITDVSEDEEPSKEDQSSIKLQNSIET